MKLPSKTLSSKLRPKLRIICLSSSYGLSTDLVSGCLRSTVDTAMPMISHKESKRGLEGAGNAQIGKPSHGD